MKPINKLPQRLVLDLEKAFKNEKQTKQKTIYQAVWLLAKGWQRKKVSEIVGLSPDRIRQLVTDYHKGGLVNLHLKAQPGNNHVLTRQQKEYIRGLITTRTPAQLGLGENNWSINLLKFLVEKEFDLTYKDLDSYRRLFIWCGFSFHKAKQLWFA